MIADDSTSYPFFALARRHRMSYRDVSILVAYVMTGESTIWFIEAEKRMSRAQLDLIYRQTMIELLRRQAVHDEIQRG